MALGRSGVKTSVENRFRRYQRASRSFNVSNMELAKINARKCLESLCCGRPGGVGWSASQTPDASDTRRLVHAASKRSVGTSLLVRLCSFIGQPVLSPLRPRLTRRSTRTHTRARFNLSLFTLALSLIPLANTPTPGAGTYCRLHALLCRFRPFVRRDFSKFLRQRLGSDRFIKGTRRPERPRWC